jgi:hypothetical protein
VALSHCWGRPIKSRLLRATHEAFLNHGIPEDALPATFRDAIVVTKRLGFRWLWIDALCIVQDDERDREAEAAQMCNVYERATFVLSAYSTPSSSAGLSFRRSVRVTMLDNKAIYFYNPITRQTDTEKLLSSRGWILQENVLGAAFP